jgi:hypothetical protein
MTTARMLVLVPGREPVPGTGGRQTCATPHTAVVYDYTPARTDVAYGYPLRVESNAPLRGGYLVVEVEGQSTPSLSAIVDHRGHGLRCRVVEAHDWPAGLIPAGYLADPDRVHILAANYGPPLPNYIPRSSAIRVVTRPVDV